MRIGRRAFLQEAAASLAMSAGLTQLAAAQPCEVPWLADVRQGHTIPRQALNRMSE